MEKQSNVDEENVREHEDIVGETLKDESNEMSEDMESQITDSIEMTEDKDHGESRHEVIKVK